jgi:hypothetical protein
MPSPSGLGTGVVAGAVIGTGQWLVARRLLGDPRARSKMQYFLHHWLQMNHVDDLSKDARLYPGFSPEIIADLRTSLNLFLDDVIWNGSSDYRKLLLADSAPLVVSFLHRCKSPGD